MYTLTAAQETLLGGTNKKHCMNVYIKDTDGTYQNLSNKEGFDFIRNVVISGDVDDPVMAAEITLIAKMFNFVLCPEIQNKINLDAAGSYAALLALNAQVKITTATVPIGVTPVDADWQNVFEGYITKIDVEDNGKTIRLFCRDLGQRIADAEMTTGLVFSASFSLATVIQSFLDNYIANPAITLYDNATAFTVEQFTQQPDNLMSVLQELALQVGYNLRYFWDTGTSAWRFTLYEPDRAKTTVDFTFSPSLYCAVSNYGYDLSGIKNAISMVMETQDSSGTVTGATASQFDDDSLSLDTNEMMSDRVVITGGTGEGQERLISWNTATVIGITPNWTVTPNTCSTYRFIGRRKAVSYPEGITGYHVVTAISCGKMEDDDAGYIYNYDTTGINGWAANKWDDYELYIIAGTGAGYHYTISASTYHALIPSSTWTVTPTTGDRYCIIHSCDSGGSLIDYGIRPMTMTEQATNHIKTKQQAFDSARAIYQDLSRLNQIIEVEVDYFFPVQLGDLYKFEGNTSIFENDIDLAVVGFVHNLGADEAGNQRNSTILKLRGKPAGGYKSWLSRHGRAGIAPASKCPHIPENLTGTTATEIAGTTSYVLLKWTHGYWGGLAHYIIRYQYSNAEWTYVWVPYLYRSFKVSGLKQSTSYNFQIQAVDRTGRTSNWGPTTAVVTA